MGSPVRTAPFDVYQVGIDEPLPEAIQRITVALLDDARRDLRQENAEMLDNGVHEARKKLKRSRAALRLIRSALGPAVYRSENAVLRDTGRLIAPLRDAWVLVDLVDELGLADPGDAFGHARMFVEGRLADARKQAAGGVLIQAIENLGAAQMRFAAFPIANALRDDFAAIAPGLQQVYVRGRHGYHRSAQEHGTGVLHEWRKRVKYLRYLLEIIAPVVAPAAAELIPPLEELGETLGVDHDLAHLGEIVMRFPEACDSAEQRIAIAGLVADRRAGFVGLVEQLGAAAYELEPEDYVDRIGDAWSMARR